MILEINFPENLRTPYLIKQEKIPCTCKISSRIFEINFDFSTPPLSGVVIDWDRKEIEMRAVAMAGGRYTHFNPGLITFKKIEKNKYKVIYLSFFYEHFGWCPILINGEYGPPGDFWGKEEDIYFDKK